MNSNVAVIARGLAGAAVGAVVGYYAFRWLAMQGFLASVLPGALVGMCAGWAARGYSLVLGVICAAIALPLSVVAEWKLFPFVADDSLLFFIKNSGFVSIALWALGAVLAFQFGKGRRIWSDVSYASTN